MNCIFCPKTKRVKRSLTYEEFDNITDSLRGKVKFLYFHLMGEPLLHPLLPQFIAVARDKGFVPVLTTNGTLLSGAQKVIEAMPHKVQISLHSHEGNGRDNLHEYIDGVMQFSLEAARRGIVVVLRLWNGGGYDSANEEIKTLISQYVPTGWTERYDGWRVAENLYLEYDGMFEWPDTERDEYVAEESFCYALRNQIGILVDGSVVPCCLDHAGEMVLGNIFSESLDAVLESPRARAIFDGFSRHIAVEPLCRRCGYANVTKRFRK